MLDRNKLINLVIYNKDTGIFIWKKRSIEYFRNEKYSERLCNIWNTKFFNKVAGKIFIHGQTKYIHISITINGVRKLFLAHRLAWLYEYGKFPENQIDHIDGNGLNNAIYNLRDVKSLENCKNRKIHSNNTSGFTGVNWSKMHDMWRVRIGVKGKRIDGGLFIDLDEAIKKRKHMNIKYGFHENHGRK